MAVTRTWMVAIVTPHRLGAPPDTTDLLDDLLAALEPYTPSVSVEDEHLGGRLWVEAPDALAAAAVAVAGWTAALRETGLPASIPTRLEVVGETELEKEIAQPNFPKLVGVSEIADLLSVSRARASELARNGTFPRPVAQLASGPVWTEPSVREFMSGWSRRPGRPRRREAVTAQVGGDADGEGSGDRAR